MALPADAGGFSTIIDARTEDEFELDHLPNAVNWPSLTNEERIRVGTLYKQVSPFEANKVGASLVAANISRHIDRHVMALNKDWQPLVYCWRGGKRSGSLALILDQIGFKVTLIEGGYKAFRSALVSDLPERVARLRHRVDMRLVAQELPWPHDRPAFLTLQGTDGRSYSAQCMSARGGPERPFDDEDLWAKIQALSHASAPGLTSTLRRLHADCAASATAAALSRSWRAQVDQFFTPAV